MTYIVYMLKLSDGSFYTGYSNNFQRRLDEHTCGRGSHYVRSRKPFTVVHTEEYNTISEAVRRERAIKKMSRLEKEKLVGL